MHLPLQRVTSRPALSGRRTHVVPHCASSFNGTGGFSQPINLPEQPGDKLKEWTKTPFDVLAFGPRAGAGAIMSLPERLQNFKNDLKRLSELAQDPRPLNAKQEALLKEVESIMVQCLEKGVVVEQDMLASVKSKLPQEAVNMLNSLIPPAPSSVSSASFTSYSTSFSSSSSMDPVDVTPEPVNSTTTTTSTAPNAPTTIYGQQDVMATQAETAATEITNAAVCLRAAVDVMNANTDPACTNMLRLSLKDARLQLARRLVEVPPACVGNEAVAAASMEGSILLDETRTMCS